MAQEMSGFRRRPVVNSGSALGRRSPVPAGAPPAATRPAVAPSRAPFPSDDTVDTFEVPAAILCAACGRADCTGCSAATDHASGMVAIVPWERSGSLWSRLWATANATTQGADAFFALLPDGEIRSAMRFAVLAELLAVGSMVLLLTPLIGLALPTLALEVLHNPELRSSALRWIALGVPALALWMVAAHVTHGAALDAGARRQGAAAQRRRALRFGLYACGWDLMAGPLGALVTLFSTGTRAALDILDHGVRAPTRATAALLQGVYKLSPEGVTRARRTGAIAAAVIALVAGGVVTVAVAAAMLL